MPRMFNQPNKNEQRRNTMNIVKVMALGNVIKHKTNEIGNRVYLKAWKLVVCGMLLFMQARAFATDDLAGLKTQAAGDFGTGSTFFDLLMVAEILSGVFFYHKTKNPAYFVGIPLVLVVLTWGLQHFLGS